MKIDFILEIKTNLIMSLVFKKNLDVFISESDPINLSKRISNNVLILAKEKFENTSERGLFILKVLDVINVSPVSMISSSMTGCGKASLKLIVLAYEPKIDEIIPYSNIKLLTQSQANLPYGISNYITSFDEEKTVDYELELITSIEENKIPIDLILDSRIPLKIKSHGYVSEGIVSASAEPLLPPEKQIIRITKHKITQWHIEALDIAIKNYEKTKICTNKELISYFNLNYEEGKSVIEMVKNIHDINIEFIEFDGFSINVKTFDEFQNKDMELDLPLALALEYMINQATRWNLAMDYIDRNPDFSSSYWIELKRLFS